MINIFYIFGKSCSGKDTIKNEILKNEDFCKEYHIKDLVYYTTRPKRPGEENGKDYYFVDEEFYQSIDKSKLFDDRAYETEKGTWRYFIFTDELDDFTNYVGIGTPETIENIQKLTISDDITKIAIFILYIKADTISILKRYYKRLTSVDCDDYLEYKEMIRRILDDDKKFDRFESPIIDYEPPIIGHKFIDNSDGSDMERNITECSMFISYWCSVSNFSWRKKIYES